MDNDNGHIRWMQKALLEAEKARHKGEIPVGAVVVLNDQIISCAHNLKEQMPSSLAHAEMIALYRAQQKLGRWRLHDCTLYVTLEPCVMCAGALQQARLQALVFGAHDPKGGGVSSLYQILSDPRLNHQTAVTSGVMQEECALLLTEFFKERRKQKLKPG